MDVLKSFWLRLWFTVGINLKCYESKLMKAAFLYKKHDINFSEPPLKPGGGEYLIKAAVDSYWSISLMVHKVFHTRYQG